jgi:hypothetical protein
VIGLAVPRRPIPGHCSGATRPVTASRALRYSLRSVPRDLRQTLDPAPFRTAGGQCSPGSGEEQPTTARETTLPTIRREVTSVADPDEDYQPPEYAKPPNP